MQQLLKLQEQHVARLRTAIDSLQTKAEKLVSDSAHLAETASQTYAEAVRSVADDDGLQAIDPASLAQWGYGVIVAATLRARQQADG